jgi:hypothetical protein
MEQTVLVKKKIKEFRRKKIIKLFCACGKEEMVNKKLKKCPNCGKKVDVTLEVDRHPNKNESKISFYEEYIGEIKENSDGIVLPINTTTYELAQSEGFEKSVLISSTTTTLESFCCDRSYGIRYDRNALYNLDKGVEKPKDAFMIREFNMFDDRSAQNTIYLMKRLAQMMDLEMSEHRCYTSQQFYKLKIAFLEPKFEQFIKNKNNYTIIDCKEIEDETIIALSKEGLNKEEDVVLDVCMKSAKFYCRFPFHYNQTFNADTLNLLTEDEEKEIFDYILTKSNYRTALLGREMFPLYK